MLPAAARLRRSEDFRVVMRKGSRAGRRRLVVHALNTANPPGPARAGFVVSKAVGNSVVRHRVTRRLRHLVAARLGTLPPGSSLVIRALPPAATATSMELGSDLDAAFRRLGLGPGHRPVRPGAPRATTARGDDDNGSAV
ncbi:ribonuclease P protein component [Amycolatopsis anabasis]|uniref:ribonuclease P protein component n=1 Tax=Amycolatopsis anabasis TaxID=1840409 RepID=UPI00131A8F97|nr:ribonuclease P protein component [Amycolatopsis anabasis]